MNGFQRVKAALELEQPDRIPLVEFIIDPAVYRALLPSATCQADFEEHFDFDAVGTGAKFRRVKEHPDGTFIDEWGVLYKPSSEVVSHPLQGSIANRRDLESWQGPDPDAEHLYTGLEALVKRFKGERFIFFHHRAAFMWSAYLNNIDTLLLNFVLEPDFAHALLDRVCEINTAIIRNAIRRGADGIVLGDDYANNAGPLMSPEMFRTFVLPRLQKVIDAIHEEGAFAVKHSDGNIWKLLDMLVGTGADGLNPMEPTAGMDIGEVKRCYGNRICLMGNIDCGELLSNGTRDQVRQAVKECIRAASPGGGFILTSSNSIHSSVNPENYLAMIEAAREFGAV